MVSKLPDGRSSKGIKRLLPPDARALPFFLCIDSNASLGDPLEGFVGEHQAELPNGNTQDFVELLILAGLSVPATFDITRSGEAGYTWVNPDGGTRHRYDYVCADADLLSNITLAGSDPDVDLSIYRLDHRASGLVFEGVLPGASPPVPRWGKPRPNLALIDQQDKVDMVKRHIQEHPPVPWTADVHTHCADFISLANTAADMLSDPKLRAPKLEWMSPQTHTLVKTKGLLLRMDRQAEKGGRELSLSVVFSHWNSTVRGPLSGPCTQAKLMHKERDRSKRVSQLLDSVSESVRSRLDKHFIRTCPKNKILAKLWSSPYFGCGGSKRESLGLNKPLRLDSCWLLLGVLRPLSMQWYTKSVR